LVFPLFQQNLFQQHLLQRNYNGLLILKSAQLHFAPKLSLKRAATLGFESKAGKFSHRLGKIRNARVSITM
jgi:hypothetical protein